MVDNIKQPFVEEWSSTVFASRQEATDRISYVVLEDSFRIGERILMEHWEPLLQVSAPLQELLSFSLVLNQLNMDLMELKDIRDVSLLLSRELRGWLS